MAWRVATSLNTLLAQVNAAHPDRSKRSDGTLGDAAHRAVASDHNPNSAGVVCALDLTHDPAHFDAHHAADVMRTHRHPNVKYIISNRRITGPWCGWTWQPYAGSNPHDKHIHVSVGVGDDGRSRPGSYDDPTLWTIQEPVIRTQEDEMPITDTDNEYGRWAKLAYQIRGRQLSRDEFRAAAVGRSWLAAMETLSDSAEADSSTDAQTLGQVARRDDWRGQIAALQHTINELNRTVTAVQADDDADKAKLQEALDKVGELTAQLEHQHDSLTDIQATEAAPKLSWLARLLAAMTTRK